MKGLEPIDPLGALRRDARLVKRAEPVSAREPTTDALGRRARALGWFSVGLGLAEMLAPEALTRAIGAPVGGPRPLRSSRKVTGVRALGAREITAGLGILSGKALPTWLWARVAGDVMDLAVLASALASGSRRNDRARLLFATAAVAGITVIDAVTAQQLGAAANGTDAGADTRACHGVRVQKSITVNRPSEEVYRFWRQLENCRASWRISSR